MKYQIYIKKEVSDIINKVAQFEGKKPNTLIKELLEQNFTLAYNQAQEVLDYNKSKERRVVNGQ